MIGKYVGTDQFASVHPHVVQWQYRDPQNDLHPFSNARNLDCKLQRCRHHQKIDQMVFGDRDRVETQAVGKQCLFNHVRIQLFATVSRIGVIARQLYAEFHKLSNSVRETKYCCPWPSKA